MDWDLYDSARSAVKAAQKLHEHLSLLITNEMFREEVKPLPVVPEPKWLGSRL